MAIFLQLGQFGLSSLLSCTYLDLQLLLVGLVTVALKLVLSRVLLLDVVFMRIFDYGTAKIREV